MGLCFAQRGLRRFIKTALSFQVARTGHSTLLVCDGNPIVDTKSTPSPHLIQTLVSGRQPSTFEGK